MTSHAAKSATDLHAVAADLRITLGQLMRRLRQQGSLGDLTRAQTAVLARLEREGPATASELARAEGVRPQSMGATIAALDEAGYITGAPDPRDGRKTVLSLSEDAVARFASGRLAREDWLFEAIRIHFTDAEQAELARTIELLKRLASAE